MTGHDGYYHDHRVQAVMRRQMLGNISYDESKEQIVILQAEALCEDCKHTECVEDCDSSKEFFLPAKLEVCGTCRGNGSHVNPSIDAHGITGDEWAEWGEEEQHSYMNGGYDVACNECGGKRVVPVPDRERASKEALAIYDEEVQSAYDNAAERAQELRYGY